jgi:hypothetical protein
VNRVRARRLLGLTFAVLAAACHGGGEADEAPDRCEAPLVVPDGFEVTGGIEDPQPDRTGVRIDLADGRGAELHFFSGIRGEFGEGLPAHGEIELRGGQTGILVGRETTWLVEWTTPPPCTPTVVLANGVDRERFRELLADAGAVRAAATGASGAA